MIQGDWRQSFTNIDDLLQNPLNSNNLSSENSSNIDNDINAMKIDFPKNFQENRLI